MTYIRRISPMLVRSDICRCIFQDRPPNQKSKAWPWPERWTDMAEERLLVRERTVVIDLKEKGTQRFRICLVYPCVQEIKTEHLGAFSYSASLEESALSWESLRGATAWSGECFKEMLYPCGGWPPAMSMSVTLSVIHIGCTKHFSCIIT